MKNRTAHIRWWAKRIGRQGVVPANGELGIANREYVTTIRVARCQKSFCTNTLSDSRAVRLPRSFARGVDALASRVQPGIRVSGSAAVYEVLRPLALAGKHATVKMAGSAITAVLERARIAEFRAEGSPVETVLRATRRPRGWPVRESPR